MPAATFFSIGKHATCHPDILKQALAASHTVGSQTWSHPDLGAVLKKSGLDAAEEEIEKRASAVPDGGRPIAAARSFSLSAPPAGIVACLGGRNIASFSCDVDSSDYRIGNPEELVK